MGEARFECEIGDARKYIYTAANGTTHPMVISNAEIAAQGGKTDIPLRRHMDRIEARLSRKNGWVV